MNATALPLSPSWSMRLLERDLLPDFLVRFGIRRLLKARLAEEDRGESEAQQRHLMRLIGRLKGSPIAINTGDANLQHYELPCGFFERVLGPHLKYSSGYYRHPTDSLEQSEAAMLALTAERARLADGERILELGCGWGSLSLWMAEHYPGSHITAVSNSRTQKRFIDERAAARGLKNLEVITCDVNRLSFPTGAPFDRVVSVEMFEHMRNYQVLMRNISGWLKPAGTLFVHIFTHKTYAYPFEVRDASDWMARYFFTGGIMPSHDLMHCFPDLFTMEAEWRWSGTHYANTARDWLNNFDRNAAAIMPVLRRTYGADAPLWKRRWRMFFLATEGLFGHAGGKSWGISQYRLKRA